MDAARTEAVEAWGVSPRVAMAAMLTPIIGGVFVVLARVHSPLFDFLVREDSIIEWAQFVGFVLAAVFGGLVSVGLARSGEVLAAAAFGVFGLGCLFIAGEEISWGQRLFGFETPADFERMNRQGETTLHNLDGVLVYFNLGMLIAGLVGATLPWVVRRWSLQGRWVQLFVPPLFTTSGYLVMFLYKLIRFTVLTSSNYTVVKIGEWAELCLAASFAVFAYLIWNRVRAERTTLSRLRFRHA